MTLVDVCGDCETLFEEGEDHCRRCGADRRTRAVKMEMWELCPTYSGDEAEEDVVQREVKPIFEPSWGRPQWYESKGRRRRGQERD